MTDTLSAALRATPTVRVLLAGREVPRLGFGASGVSSAISETRAAELPGSGCPARCDPRFRDRVTPSTRKEQR